MKQFYALVLSALVATTIYSQSSQMVQSVELSDSRFQFVNKNTGAPVNGLTWDEVDQFVNGFAKVALNHQWGFIDWQGKPIVEPVYESVRNFRNHLAAVKQNGKWGFIDEKGTVVIPFAYDIVYDFKEVVSPAYKNNAWALIDRQGKIVKSLDIDVCWGFNNGMARITRNGQSGTLNTKGEIIMAAEPKKVTARSPITIRMNDAADCPDNINFEAGDFTNWNCFIGSVAAVGTDNVITVNPSPPTANRHVIYQSSNPSAIDPYGLFPTNPPDGSNYALKLGNNINGAEAERVTYQINVPANSSDASITYRYAVVFQDPGHLSYQQPRFSAKLLDVTTNTYLPCASYEYVATSSIPGFSTSPVDDSVRYKPWASVFINLSAYAGRTLILEFTTADCTKGAHWGYAYVDVGDCNIVASIDYNCQPSFANLSGPPGFEFYNWYDNAFATQLASGQNVTLTPAPALNTTLHVEVIPFNGFGCQDTLDVKVINNLPTANAGPDKTICPGDHTVVGTTPAAGTTYSWTPVTYIVNPNAPSPVVIPPITSTFVVTASNTINGCIDTDTVTVFVQSKPAPAFATDPRQCLTGNSFSFSNTTTGAATYYWQLGDGSTSTSGSPVHAYANAGPYSIKLVATNIDGCKDSITHNLIVDPNPVVTAGTDKEICRGNSAQLQASGALTYNWSPLQEMSCYDCANPVVSPASNARYVVTGYNSANCPATDTVIVTVYQPIDINVSPGRSTCGVETTNLQTTGSAASYSWTPATGLSSTVIANPVATPSQTTEYRVIGYDGHNCFTDTAFVKITVNPPPAIDLGPNVTLSTGSTYNINPVTQNGPIISWQWTPAIDLNCADCPNPTATVKKDITYHALITNVYGCTALDSMTILTFCDKGQVFIPNAFTPDGDGVNDILMVRAKGVETIRSFRIFTRWGELVFEKTNFPPNTPSYGWDGKIKGKTGAAEVYVYTAEVTCDNYQTYTYKGNVTILK